MSDPQQAQAILATADLIHSAETVALAISQVAREISEALRESHPLLLCVMNGGVPFAGQLMTQLAFPLDFDHVHATRYGAGITGGALSWRSEPSTPVGGRTVLLVDDILDEGLTLAAIRERLLHRGAKACHTAVLADKPSGARNRSKPISSP
jgi:hypoxanthine phosphoribosyltransferase